MADQEFSIVLRTDGHEITTACMTERVARSVACDIAPALKPGWVVTVEPWEWPAVDKEKYEAQYDGTTGTSYVSRRSRGRQ